MENHINFSRFLKILSNLEGLKRIKKILPKLIREKKRLNHKFKVCITLLLSTLKNGLPLQD